MKRLSLAIGLLLAAGSPGATLHVPADYPTIQAGIDAAAPGDVVLIADGTYTGPGNVDLDTLGKAITVRGEHGPAETVIDCEFDGRGFSIQSGEGPGTRVEGLTITAPSAGAGGGFYIIGSGPVIDSCWVDSAEAASGGGLYCENGSPELTGCIFSGNQVSGSGGGVFAVGGSLKMFSCIIESNFATRGAGLATTDCQVDLLMCSVSGNDGAISSGIDCAGGSVRLTSCEATGNGFYGGGLRLASDDARVLHCTISGNDDDADQGRGGGVRIVSGTAILVGCTIQDNSAGYDYSGDGGGVAIDAGATATLIDCLIEGNIAYDHFFSGGEGGGVYAAGGAALIGCTILSNGGAAGGGVFAFGEPVFHNCLFAGNGAAIFGGGVMVQAGAFTGCIFDGNKAWLAVEVGRGGGAAFIQGAPTFDACLFTGNTSEGHGGDGSDGGGAVWSDGAAKITNCIFSGNADTGAGFGGAMVTSGGDRIVNCVFYNNAVIGGAASALYAAGPGSTVANSIIRANGPAPLLGPLSVSYSNIQGAFEGPGNIDADPLFADPPTLNFRLAPGSPCIDAGDSGALPPEIVADYDGAPRRADDRATPDTGAGPPPVVDMGAFEVPGLLDPCQTDLILAPDGQAGDEFRYAAIDGPTMAIGAFAANDAGDNSGALYIYGRQDPLRWEFQTKLLPPGLEAGDFYAARVCLDGDRVIVSASRDDNHNGENAGCAYIFRREGEHWAPEGHLFASDGSPAAQFGYAVSISGDRALCGSWKADPGGISNAGAAYIFRREGDQWVQEAVLVAPDPLPQAGLGWAVDLKGDVALIGAADANAKTGCAYIFRRAGQSWVQEARLEAPGGAPGDRFGFAVAQWPDRAVVGAPWHDLGAEDAGAAFVFARRNGGWLLEAALQGSLLAPGNLAGQGVAIDGTIIAVGAVGADDDGDASGAGAVFRHEGSGWTEVAHVHGEGSGPEDVFGKPVALGEGVLAIGAPLHDGPGGKDQGAVFVFSLAGCPCYPDFAQDGTLDVFDFLEFVNQFVAGDGHADCDQSATLDLFDFLCFQNAFSTGC